MPEDAALTDLEIDILTDYTESQVSQSSQFILVNLWTWCKGNYNITKLDSDDFGGRSGEQPKYHKDQVKINCMKGGYTLNVLDYRAQMTQSGYEIIMAYALQSSSFSDNAYLKRTNLRKVRLRVVPSALIYASCANFIALILTFAIYGSKKSKQGLENVPRFLWKLVTIFAVSSFLAVLIATVMVMTLLNSVASEVHSLLGDFNVSYSLTSVWVALMWAGFAVSLVHALSWMLPTWCANPSDTYDDNEFDETYYVPKYDSSRKSSKPKRTSRAVSAIFSNNGDTTLMLSDVKSTFDHSYDSDFIATPMSEKPPKFPAPQKLFGVQYEMHSDDEMDRELLKLGERFARKPSVRFLNVKTRAKKKSHGLKDIMNLNDTRDLLYGEHHESQGPYQIDESDDRFRILSNNSIKRKPKIQIPTITINDDDEDKNAPLVPTSNKKKYASSARSSLLNEHEINVLEMNAHLNRLD